MKHNTKQYAAALLAALKNKSADERKKIINNFLLALRKNKDFGRLGLIVKECEKQYFRELGLKKVRVESAASVGPKIKKEIENTIGDKIFFQESEKPELLAGMKILIDDEILIDASAKRQLDRLFSKG